MIEILGIDHRVDRERLVQRQILLPLYLFHLFINGISIFGLEMINRFQNAQGSTAVEIRFIKQFLITRKGNHTTTELQVVGTYS